MEIHGGKDKDRVNVKDFSVDSDGEKKLRMGLMNTGIPDMTYSEVYLVAMFGTIKEIQQSIVHIDGTKDFRPWLLTKLLVSMIADIGERQRLLAELDKLYALTLSKCKIDESAFSGYEPDQMEASKRAKLEQFWFLITVAIIPVIGSVISYLNNALNLSQRLEVYES